MKLILITLLISPVFFSCEPTNESDLRLNGMNLTQLVNEKGDPDEEHKFKLEKNVLEFRSSLLKYYDEEKPIFVKELSWVDNNIKHVCWLMKFDSEWKVVDNLKWDMKKVKF